MPDVKYGGLVEPRVGRKMTQRNLFSNDEPDRTYGIDFEPCDPSVTPAERPRLSRQCQEMLDRLRLGRASNDELARISRKYTSRTSDLRKAGYDVRCVMRDYSTGETWYELVE